MKFKKNIVYISPFLIGLAFAGLFISYYCGWLGHHLILIKTTFNSLPDWGQDDHRQALETLQKSCDVIIKADSSKPFSRTIPQGGTVKDWKKICASITPLDKSDKLSARKFFEFWFEPYRVYDNYNPKGLFTGYYLPTLRCSLEKTAEYSVPIHAIPDDWVKVDLGVFDQKLKGRTLVGQLKDKQLYPYPDRATITSGVLDKKAKILAWCDDKIDVAFAHIQGSAIVQLPDQEQFLIGYDGSNGRSYTAIGKVLIKSKELTPQNSFMQSIRAWFLQHPDKIDLILNKNASYVFFRKLKNNAPLGSQQVPLTSERSLAVDKKYFPLGVPFWLDSMVPNNTPQMFVPFRRLLIAQDTGGAIKGIIRGDVYWGSGEQAAYIAGHMKSPGSYWILLPRISSPISKQ